MQRSILMFTALLLAAGTAGAQTWQQRHILPLDGRVNDIAFAGVSCGWAVDEFGGIAHTTDGGETWARQESGMSGPLISATAVDAQTAWAAGIEELFQTSNGGATWQMRTTEVPHLSLADAAFVSAAEGWLLGSINGAGRYLLHTQNGGQIWSLREIREGAVQALAFLDATTGIAYGPDLFRTTDGGEHWTLLSSLTGVWALDLASAPHWWALNGDGLQHSTDGGDTWSGVDTPFPPFCMDFADALHGWVASADGDAAFTNDGGVSWTAGDVPIEGMIYFLRAVDPAHAWLGGDYGNLIGTTDSGASWVHHGGRRSRALALQDLAFASGRSGWAVGGQPGAAFSGGILYTQDGGQSWMPQLLEQPWTLACVLALDSTRLWAAGRTGDQWQNGLLLHSTSGGHTWTEWTSFPGTPLEDLAFATADSGWALSRHLIFHTTDGGNTWYEQWTTSDDNLAALWMGSAEEGFVVGAGGAILRTTNGGTSWVRQGSATFNSLTCITASDSNTLWAGGQAVLLKNEARTWNWVPQAFPGSGTITDLLFTDDVHGHVIEDTGLLTTRVWETTTGGASWTLLREEPRRALKALGRAGEHLFAAGQAGLILDYGDAAGAAPEPHARPLPQALALAAYPNPFNAATRLSFSVPARSRVQLAVYDLTGRLVTTLADQVFDAGPQALNFEGAGLASGIYFARLSDAGASQTQKLVLLK